MTTKSIVTGRTWAWGIVPCPLCGVDVDEPCKNTKDGKSYGGLYTHRARVSGAVSLALTIHCPKCGRPPTIPCFISEGGKGRDNVHQDRARGARKKAQEARRMSARRGAEVAVASKLSWAKIDGGRWATHGRSTVIAPSEGGSIYVIDQQSGRLFRSVTADSNKLISCQLRDVIHAKWLSKLAPDVPGGEAMLDRADGVATPTTKKTTAAPKEEPMTQPTPVPTPPPPVVAGFLQPEVRTKCVIIEEIDTTLRISRSDLARMIVTCGAGPVRGDRIKVSIEGPEDDPTVVVTWSKTTETEKSG